MVEHLAELGHRGIAHLAGPQESRPGRSGSGPSGRRCGRADSRDDSGSSAAAYSEAAGRTALLRAARREDRPTAIVAGNDLLALGGYEALDGPGCGSPPISVVGFNDMPFVERLQPAADHHPHPAVRDRCRGGPPVARPAQRPHGDPAGRAASGAPRGPRLDRSPSRPSDRPREPPDQPPAPITVDGSMPRSLSSTRAAFRPARPDTEPPGCAVAPVW